MYKAFFKNVIPSMFAFALAGIYAIVDGFFVGRSIGDMGLAGINIAYPITAFIQSVGTGIGLSGSIYYSLEKGAKKYNLAEKFMGNTISLLAISSIIVTLLLFILAKPLLIIFGAKGELLSLAFEYIKVIIFGTFFQIISTGLIPIIRNNDKSFFAMLAMVAGFFTNIILDYYFVFVLKYGMTGAGLATIIGQAVTAIIACKIVFSKKLRLKKEMYIPDITKIKKILITSISPFGLTLSPNIALIIINKSAVTYGADKAVAVYAVISYVVCVVQLLLQSIGDGSQPLISLYIGENNHKNTKKILALAYITSIITALVSSAIILNLRFDIPIFFGASENISKDISQNFPIFVYAFIFMAIVRITTSYFYAAGKDIPAFIMVYGETIILFIFSYILLPKMYDIVGVWLATPVTSAIMTFIGIILIKKYNKKILVDKNTII